MSRTLIKLALTVSILVVAACVSTARYNPDGSYAGEDTRLGGESGPVIASSDADGNVVEGPVITAAKNTAPLLPPPFGTIAASLLAVAPWLVDKRSRRQILVKPASKLKQGDIAGAAQSLLSGVGLGHSTPNPREALMALRQKGIAEGWVDPVTGLLYEEIGRRASGVDSTSDTDSSAT